MPPRSWWLARGGRQDLLAFFNDVQVDGVYESHVPLLFRALTDLGCVCAVQQRTRAADTEFELGELQTRSPEDVPYLAPGSLR